MLHCDATSKELRLKMKATVATIEKVDEQVARYLIERDLPINDFDIRLTIREALLNAVLHGSNEKSEQEVELEMSIQQNHLRCMVQDTGPGFDWHNHSSEIEETGINGRGIALLRLLSDELSWNETGNRVMWNMNYHSGGENTSVHETSIGDAA